MTYRINIKRLIMRKLVLGVADGSVSCDGEPMFEAKDMRVTLFAATEAS